MLDYNHQPKLYERITALIDQAMDAERCQQPARSYLGASRLGVACDRALQYEYAGAPVDYDRDLSGRTLRIFEVGHVLEELVIRWLRMAGFELYNKKSQWRPIWFLGRRWPHPRACGRHHQHRTRRAWIGFPDAVRMQNHER